MRSRCLQRINDESGAVAILVAVFTTVMFVFAALIVDLGVARSMRRDAQNAADAAALAGANALYAGSSAPDFAAAVQAAKRYAEANFGTSAGAWSTCSNTTPLAYAPTGESCITFDSATTPANVRVLVPAQTAESFFGGVVDYQGMQVDAVAQAKVDRTSRPQCAFCVIGPGDHDLKNGTLAVTDGDVWINGDIELGPHGRVDTTNGTTFVEGSIDSPAQVDDPKVTGASPVGDPLAHLQLPPDDMSSLPTMVKSDPCTQGPGFYRGVNLSGNGDCVLEAGLYVFTDPLSITGTASFEADGVTLYFTCGINGVVGPCLGDTNPGTLDAGGGSGFVLKAPTSGPRKGLAIAYDRGNTATLTMRGNVTNGVVVGTIYAPGSSLDIRGNSCGTAFYSMVVLDDIAYSGNPSCFDTTYDVSQNVEPGGAGDTGLVL